MTHPNVAAAEDMQIVADDQAETTEPVAMDLWDTLERTREASEATRHMLTKQYELPDEWQFATLTATRETKLRRNGRHYLEIYSPVAITGCIVNVLGMNATVDLPLGWSLVTFPDDATVLTPTGTTQLVMLRATNFPIAAPVPVGVSAIAVKGTAGNYFGSPMAIYASSTSSFYLMRSATTDGMPPEQVPMVAAGLFNGGSYDRPHGNQDTLTLISASGATTTQTTSDQTNINYRGLKVVLNVTNAGTGSITLEIDGRDSNASLVYYALLTGAAVTTNSTNIYTIYPGITATANVSASDILTRTWRIKVTANNANPMTYTVAASLIV